MADQWENWLFLSTKVRSNLWLSKVLVWMNLLIYFSSRTQEVLLFSSFRRDTTMFLKNVNASIPITHKILPAGRRFRASLQITRRSYFSPRDVMLKGLIAHPVSRLRHWYAFLNSSGRWTVHGISCTWPLVRCTLHRSSLLRVELGFAER